MFQDPPRNSKVDPKLLTLLKIIIRILKRMALTRADDGELASLVKQAEDIHADLSG